MQRFHDGFKWLVLMLVCSLPMLPWGAYAESLPDPHPQVAQLIAGDRAPFGVVFDIETLDAQALPGLADYVSRQIGHLQAQYPDADIAVISHGAEEQALSKQAANDASELHDTFSRLVEDQGVSMHVCGAVAGLKGLEASDFPEFVTFSPSGMAQLNDYKALGYDVITIHSLSEQERKALFDSPTRYFAE
ncbi:MAG: DsrE family protein [Hydrogenovibrio sp.]|uniref:DsrE family protein n=1 Tax=Hydrogenovibrio sp. TaxID=2065821 RepID=UPI00286FBFA5|nr:DsrE family protein [Hydrogenovibrio sp.]MDR9497599.1 DsrE family protein [Hydrogenovibrio sp.]